jgi:hypothetical protein
MVDTPRLTQAPGAVPAIQKEGFSEQFCVENGDALPADVFRGVS